METQCHRLQSWGGAKGGSKFQSGQWANGSPTRNPHSGVMRMRTRLLFLKILYHHPPEICLVNV